MTPLTDDENRYYEEQKQSKYVEKRFVIIKNRKRDLNYTKMLEIIVIYWTFRGTAHSICNLQYKVLEKFL